MIVRIGFVLALLLLLLVGSAAQAADLQTFPIDVCIGKKCNSGIFHSITVTGHYFIVLIEPNWCSNKGYRCATSYGSITYDDELPARLQGYELGTKSSDMFSVYIPRGARSLYVEKINGKEQRFGSLDLTPFAKIADVPVAAAATGAAAVVAEPEVPIEVRQPDALALVIGIEEYRYAPAASFAENDAGMIRKYLVERLGFDPQRVLFRVGTEATRGEFERALSADGWLARRTTPASDVVVYFAGHGGCDWESGPVLLPQDIDPEYPAMGLPLDQLYKRVSALGGRSATIVLDTSFSWKSRDGEALLTESQATACSPGGSDLPDGLGVYLAAAGGQINGVLAESRHGRFTYQFLMGLAAEAEADGNRDGVVTLGEMDEYLEGRFAGDESNQTPLVLGDPSQALLPLP